MVLKSAQKAAQLLTIAGQHYSDSNIKILFLWCSIFRYILQQFVFNIVCNYELTPSYLPPHPRQWSICKPINPLKPSRYCTYHQVQH
jgi:hypothetical protein